MFANLFGFCDCLYDNFGVLTVIVGMAGMRTGVSICACVLVVTSASCKVVVVIVVLVIIKLTVTLIVLGPTGVITVKVVLIFCGVFSVEFLVMLVGMLNGS